MADVKRPRRYYLQMRRVARQFNEFAGAAAFQAKQEAEPGTSLAADFPFRAELEPLGYTTTEDLDGADVDELVAAGLTLRKARIIIAAL